MYQTGGTIKETIELVQKHDYVLPAIQREFVWKPEQIERLFDSLMQGYPFGTFLLWRVDAENSNEYKFYDFVRDYHERDAPHCPRLPAQQGPVTAVLDGQQRLTALNIGLCGSMATKLPNKWKDNPNAYPVRHLYLDLLASLDEHEDGDEYRFAFLRADQVDAADPEKTCWFKVADILPMDPGPPMLRWLNERLRQDQLDTAFATLTRLHEVIHTKPVVAYYEEKSQELSTVLSIFIRTNSGGTILSYSDLLLSIAVAQWSELDAREEIHTLVDEINQVGAGFGFSQDLVLKAGLVLTDVNNIKFKVENFDAENMARLESGWSEVSEGLLLAARLLASFGYSEQNLKASSVILPIAYYLKQRSPGDRYVTATKYSEDRKRIQRWVAKSLLKSSGIWGSGLDTFLAFLRETIREHGQAEFPAEMIEAQMARRGKSLAFDSEEIDEILDLEYGKARTFPLLTLLFPFVDLQNHFHVDHVFPKSGFHRNKLRPLDFSHARIRACRERRNRIANLQLLDGAANIEKQAAPPLEWLHERFPAAEERSAYLDRHDLGEIPETMEGFEDYYETRRQRLRARLEAILGVS